MRYIQKRPSSKDKDILVFEFAFGKKELELLVGITETAYKNLPRGILEINPTKNRLNNIRKALIKTLKENS